MQKGFIYSPGTREADVAHGRHVVEPREPTWTPTWTREQWAGRWWTHELVGPGDVVEYDALDQSAQTDACRSPGIRSTRSSSKARAQMGAVDRISDIRLSRLNHDFGESPSNTWPRMDALIKIGRAKKLGDVGSLPIKIAQSQLSNLLHQIGQPAFFAIFSL